MVNNWKGLITLYLVRNKKQICLPRKVEMLSEGSKILLVIFVTF